MEPIYYQSRAVHGERATAFFRSSPLAPELSGTVDFIQQPYGVEVIVQVEGLPDFEVKNGSQIGPHGFHIHEKGVCEVGNGEKPFETAGEHWNPTKQPHGNHAGDFPVLFSNEGRARMIFFTDRFEVNDIIGKAVIIHQGPDDYQTQPSGDSGLRIACGVIERL
ncbi:superoxide dismutase family protein [Halobacillus sp. Marseille-P3879]|uniref:superoxide dismutase family protein n=1 Tax=Halobacillus sp. Marseille-P3879 TaxID=2045014 RepID=UPI00358E4ADF